MKNKTLKKLAVTAVLGVAVLGVAAQDNCSSSSGSSVGSMGSFSCIVGQTTIFHSPVNVSLGKTSITPDAPSKTEALQAISVFPNPTNEGFKLEFKEFNPELKATYTLTDLQGKLIENKEICGSETYVNTENLIAGNYLLQINLNNKNIQTFKIIKIN